VVAVPPRRSREAGGQIDGGAIPELALRAGDGERPVLAEPVGAAAKQRRLDFQREAHRFAERRCKPQRREWQVRDAHPFSEALTDLLHEFVQRDEPLVTDEIDAALTRVLGRDLERTT
jgi:hypothetical protein